MLKKKETKQYFVSIWSRCKAIDIPVVTWPRMFCLHPFEALQLVVSVLGPMTGTALAQFLLLQAQSIKDI